MIKYLKRLLIVQLIFIAHNVSLYESSAVEISFIVALDLKPVNYYADRELDDLMDDLLEHEGNCF